jgi:acid phosphatase (class A)
MKLTHWLRGLIFCGTLVGALALAADEAKTTKWLSADEEQALAAAVPPPPAPDSLQDKADLAEVLVAQKMRTDASIAEAKLDEKLSLALFQPIFGANITPASDPKFYDLMTNVAKVTKVVNETAKNKYQRLRPYLGHPDVVHGLFPVKQFSYPSGHAMASYAFAVVLGEIFPDKKQAFLDRAAKIAQSRVDAGVHYPSDIKEGETLGKATAAAILAKPDFQADLTAVRAEVAK